MAGAGTLRAVREAVIRTGDWPVLGAAYRGIYAASVVRAGHVLGADTQTGVWLRGSAVTGAQPGLSDIDLVLLPPACASFAEEESRCARVRATLARLNRPLPLFRDVHVLFPDELQAVASVGAAIPRALVRDSRRLSGPAGLPAVDDSEEAFMQLQCREALYWAHRAGEHLAASDGLLDERLARRALHKAQVAVAHLRGAPGQQAPGGADRHATWARLAQLLAALDVALETMPTPRLGPAAAVAALPAMEATAPVAASRSRPMRAFVGPPMRSFVDAALALPGVESVLLTQDGSSRVDRRTYVVVDPSRPGLADTLRMLCALRRGLSAQVWGRQTYGAPWVTTAAQLRWAVCMPMSVFEPLERHLHGELFGAALPPPLASRAQVARSAVEKLVKLVSRAREGRHGGPKPRDRAMVQDGIHGLLPDLQRLLIGEPADRHPAPGTQAGQVPAPPEDDWHGQVLWLRMQEAAVLPALLEQARPQQQEQRR